MGSLANSIENVGGIWLTDVHQLKDGVYYVEGLSVYRDRIPRFAQRYPGSILRKVTIAEIRGKRVYDFQIDLNYPGK